MAWILNYNLSYSLFDICLIFPPNSIDTIEFRKWGKRYVVKLLTFNITIFKTHHEEAGSGFKKYSLGQTADAKEGL